MAYMLLVGDTLCPPAGLEVLYLSKDHKGSVVRFHTFGFISLSVFVRHQLVRWKHVNKACEEKSHLIHLHVIPQGAPVGPMSISTELPVYSAAFIC